MSFRYSKETLFLEFDDAKNKDIKISKKKSLFDKENDYYTNRIQFCKDHIELKKKHPEYYENLDIKLGSKFSLNHDGYFMMEDGEEFEIRLTNGVKYKLTNHLSLDLNYNYTFDDTSPDGIDQDQTQINLQLGYSL